MNLTHRTTTELADLIRHKQASSVEVVQAHLTRIAQVNPQLNAVVQLVANQALADAAAADQRLAQGKIDGPLHGVPMTLKDSIDTAGVITTAGTTGRANFVPDRNATVAKRLRGAGAILLGKTNTPELTWAFETNNLVYGRTNNPYDVNYSPGGSSGGAAAIVAARGAPFDIGSDSGGSIRLPSHLCGLAGLKPTSGRVPRTGHILGPEGIIQSFTTLGPIARSVMDLWLLFGIIAGPNRHDASMVPVPLGDPNAVSLQGLRVAMHTDNGLSAPDPEVVTAVQAAAAALQTAGAVVEERKPQALQKTLEMDDILYRAYGPASMQRLLEACGTTTPGPEVQSQLDLAPISGNQCAHFVERWDDWRGRMLSFWDTADVILCPPYAKASLPHGGSEDYSAFSYTFAYNMTGWPAAVVRAGTTANGLPVGVQIVASPFREDVAIAVARHLEQALGGYVPPSI